VIFKGTIQIKPTSKDRPKLTKSGRAYNTQKTKDAQRQQAFLLRMLSKQQVNEETGEQKQYPIKAKLPLAVNIRFFHKGGVKNSPKTTVPDIDNLLKLTLDAITNAGIWRDDNQITKICSEDLWAGDEPSRIEIEIDEHIIQSETVQLKIFG
jgi:Holliday junction resolvase RusA-like endonuclease